MDDMTRDIISARLGEKLLGADLPNNLQVVRQEIERLDRAILHLRRSNDEMMAEDPADPDFLEAVAENTSVVAKYAKKIAELKELLEAITGAYGQTCGTPEVASQQRHTVEVVTAPTTIVVGAAAGHTTATSTTPATTTEASTTTAQQQGVAMEIDAQQGIFL